MSTTLDALLALAKHVPLFPCRRESSTVLFRGKEVIRKPKSPLTEHGFEDATQEPSQIIYWHGQFPDCLWGVPTGSRTGLIVIDYDTEKADEAAREWLTAHSEALLATRSHSTVSGGRHYLFRSRERYSSGVSVTLGGVKRQGLDIRAEGGYIVWWPLEGMNVTGDAVDLPPDLLAGRGIESRVLRPLSAIAPQSWGREAQKAADLLAFHNPEDYDEWIGAGMSIHAASGGSDAGFQLWSAWSSGEITGDCPRNYSGLDDLRYRWESFSSDKPREKLRGIGSLVATARSRGYVNGYDRSEEVPRETSAPESAPPQHEEGYLDALIASSPLQILVAATAGTDEEKHVSPIPARARINWAELEGDEPPAREWILEHWIPAKRDTLLAGKGGIGKTLLAQCLCSALAMGGDYIDEVNQPRTCLLWAGEDDKDELWRRQLNINRHCGATLAQLDQRLHVMDYSNADITLAAAIYGVLGATPMLKELEEQIHDLKVDVVFLDNVARIYGGNENDRHQVTQFMAWLRAAVAPAALVLLSHPAKVAGSEFSGSTAWEGAVRSRLFLSDKHPDEKGEDQEEAGDPNVRYIARRKSNYSANDIRRMVLVNGVLVPDKIPERGVIRTVGSSMVKDTIRRAIRTLAERGIFGNESTASPYYLPKLTRDYKLMDRASHGQIIMVVREMILAGELVRGEVGKNPNRTPRMGLMLPP